MKTSDFSYNLPKELIAQNPLKNRGNARLMVIKKHRGALAHLHIRDLQNILTSNDVLVFNETKVFPARLRGKIKGKSVEILLIQKKTPEKWQCMVKPGKKFILGATFETPELKAEIKEIMQDGTRMLHFNKSGSSLKKIIDATGEMPLPPYIKTGTSSKDQYQTVYAKHLGSIAAPTAGFHFTKELLEKLKKNGINQEFVTLHVGRGTFEPVKSENIKYHKMHSEWFELSEKTAKNLNRAKKEGKRIIAVGTTTTRVLESCSNENGILKAKKGETQLFITPGTRFKFIDALITNFHLPESTLLMLVSAFAGRDLILRAYNAAIQRKYRFYSFGDAMLIL